MYLTSIPALKLSNFLLVTLCVSMFNSFVSGTPGYPCHKYGKCGCRYKNGSKTYEISLEGIVKEGE